MPILEKVCISLYLGLFGPYWALFGPYWALFDPYWVLFGPIWPYWALFGPIGPYLALTVKQKRDTEGSHRGHRIYVALAFRPSESSTVFFTFCERAWAAVQHPKKTLTTFICALSI